MLINLADFRKHSRNMRDAGSKSAEALTLGKLADECNRLVDLQGLSGDYAQGYRQALVHVQAYILAELKGKS